MAWGDAFYQSLRITPSKVIFYCLLSLRQVCKYAGFSRTKKHSWRIIWLLRETPASRTMSTAAFLSLVSRRALRQVCEANAQKKSPLPQSLRYNYRATRREKQTFRSDSGSANVMHGRNFPSRKANDPVIKLRKKERASGPSYTFHTSHVESEERQFNLSAACPNIRKAK